MKLDTAAICGFTCGYSIWVSVDMLSCLKEAILENL